MISVSHGSDVCHLAPHSYFKLLYGVRPSFGCFTMGASAAQAAVAAGTSATLQLHDISLYKIYPIRCEVGDALTPAIGRIYFADERIMWPFYYGTQDYNTYKLDRSLSRDITGSEKDFDLDNLNSYAIVDLIDGGGGDDQIKIAGDHTALFVSGVMLKLEGSSESDNDGTYAINSSSYSSPNTTINIPTGSLTDDTASGGTVAIEWTFTKIFVDIFEATLGLATANYTLQLQTVGGDAPTRRPRNIRGKNIPVPEILHQLLAQANCFLAVDLLTNPPHYQVIPIGDEDVWQSALTYRDGEVTTVGGVRYRSLQNVNQNKDPSSETDWWTILISHNLREVLISPLASRSADAKMLVSRPYFENGGFYETQGAATGIGGTGNFYTPSPYEAFYDGSTLENSTFLISMGNELAKEYKLSFQNTWYNVGYAGALPLSLGRGAQEITWELTGQEGFTTHIKSFRPREEPFPLRHTLFVYNKHWTGGSGGAVRQIAYCKEDSPDADEITCYLDVDLLDWDSGKTYDINNWVEVAGTEYKSLQDDNLNHAVSDGNWWEEGTLSVTIKCLIINGTSLMYAMPFLNNGDPIIVGTITVGGEAILYCTNIEFNGAVFTS